MITLNPSLLCTNKNRVALTILLITDEDDYEYSHWSKINSHKCDYYNEDTFKSTFVSKKADCLSFYHQNIRGLKSSFTELVGYINNLDTCFTLIGITESWLDEDSEHLYNIPGYTAYTSVRSNRRGGDLVLYVRDNDVNSCVIRNDLSFISNDGEFESIFAEITCGSEKYIVGLFYRPPNKNVPVFNDELQNKPERHKCILLGDFNIDLLKSDRHGLSNDFVVLLKTY